MSTLQKKYELLPDDAIKHDRRTRYRICALGDFGIVRAGDLDGYLEKEDNLSHTGDAWVFGNAKVFDEANIVGNAWVYSKTKVLGNARIAGYAKVSGDVCMYGGVEVGGNAWISNS